MFRSLKPGRVGAAIAGAFLLMAGFASAAQAGAMYGAIGRGSSLNPGALITVDQTDGSGALIGDPITPGGLTGIDFDQLGRLWGSSINDNRLSSIVRINPDTGALISSVAITGSTDMAAISIGDLTIQPGTGAVYGIRSNADGTGSGGELYTIDTMTGVATEVGDTGVGRGGGLAFATDGTLYFSEFGSLHTLSLLDASVLTTTTLDNSDVGDGLAIRSDGVFFATSGGQTDDRVWTINPTTGVTTLVGTTGVGSSSDLAFRPMAMPEPATLLLLGVGLAGLGVARRRRRAA